MATAVGIPGRVVQAAKNSTTSSIDAQRRNKIAKKYGCSVSDIQQWNKLSSSKIYVGQKLKIQK